MRVCAALYVDNQEAVRFPVDYIVRNMHPFDAIYVFGADAENVKVLQRDLEHNPLKSRIRFVNIWKKIVLPEDIAKAQNSCIEFLRLNDTADFFVFVQADILLVERSFDFLGKWFLEKHIDKSVHLTVRHLRLYVQAHQTYFGVTAMGRHSPKRFVGDGAYVDESPYWNHDWDCLDIGYFSTDQYYRHVLNNQKIWKNNEAFRELSSLYATGKKGFVKRAIEYMLEKENPSATLIPVDSSVEPYKSLIGYFNLHQDYCETSAIVSEMRSFLQKWNPGR